MLTVEQAARDIIAGDDGFYVFWPSSYSHGAMSADTLRAIADELDRRNAAWKIRTRNPPPSGCGARPDALELTTIDDIVDAWNPPGKIIPPSIRRSPRESDPETPRKEDETE